MLGILRYAKDPQSFIGKLPTGRRGPSFTSLARDLSSLDFSRSQHEQRNGLLVVPVAVSHPFERSCLLHVDTSEESTELTTGSLGRLSSHDCMQLV